MTDTKKLAEFAVGFLGLEYKLGCHWYPNGGCNQIYSGADTLFDERGPAPILAHLAKMEMEKRGFHWISSWGYHSPEGSPDYFAEFNRWDEDTEQNKWGKADNENEYQALWSAIQEALIGVEL